MDKILLWINKKYPIDGGNLDKRERLIMAYFKVQSFFRKAKRLIPCTYLCCKYPFLKPYSKRNKFFQTSCWYYCIDEGWRKAFGIQLCDELLASLKRHNFVKKYIITDVKEKFGELNIYDDGAPEEVHDILLKYEYISARTCIICGKPARYRSKGWIEPYCKECFNTWAKLNNEPSEAYKDFDWYGYKK